MNDDFNTGLAASTVFDLAKAINIYYTAVTAGEAGIDGGAIAKAMENMKTITGILGILDVAWSRKSNAANDEDFAKLMDVILAVREEARAAKQYQMADSIRDRLAGLGIAIEDSPTGARWKKSGV